MVNCIEMFLCYGITGNSLLYWQSDIEQNEQIDPTRNSNNLFGLAQLIAGMKRHGKKFCKTVYEWYILVVQNYLAIAT